MSLLGLMGLVSVGARTMPVEILMQVSLGSIESVDGVGCSSSSHDLELSLLEHLSGSSEIVITIMVGVAVVRLDSVGDGVSSHVNPP